MSTKQKIFIALLIIACIIFPPLILILIALGIIYKILGFFGLLFQSSNISEYQKFIDPVNKEHGTNFSTEKLVFGCFPDSGIFFDPDSKKICILTNKKNTRVVDFSYIKSWELHWTEVSDKGHLFFKNVHFQFATSDLENPIIRIPIPSKKAGEDWNHRLNILFSA